MTVEGLGHRLLGERGDVVLLLNGGMMTYEAWDPVSSPLGDRFRILGCDLRGQLRSPGGGHDDLSGHVADVVGLLNTLDLGAVHVLGTSFGGEVGLLLAARHPERVQSLAAVTAVDRTPPGLAEDSRHLAQLVTRVLEGGEPGLFHDALVRDVYSEAYRTAHAAELANRRRRALPDAWYRGLLGILANVEDFDLTPDLEAIVCPALVVHAAADAVMPAERVCALASALGCAELAVHPTSGHALVAEDPGWLADVYLDFLGRRCG